MANDSAPIQANSDYDKYCAKWQRARDVIEGEDAIKAGNEIYLPRLSGQDDPEYKAYRDRSEFFDATSRTLEGLQGMLFRKEPVIALPDGQDGEFIKTDVDMSGATLPNYAKKAARQVLGIGRCGTFIDWSEAEKRSAFVFYQAEQIWNWREERLLGRMRLSLVALYECMKMSIPYGSRTVGKAGDISELDEMEVEQLKILKLVDLGGRLQYEVDVWQYLERESKKEWIYIETMVPSRRGQPLDFIPFEFHSPAEDAICCCKPPLEDIIHINLHHYKVNADFNHGLHFAALPTAWVAGFKTDTIFKIGSSVAWVSDNADAKAGFLEFTGQGLDPLEKALAADESRMAVLGARLIEQQKRDAETAEAMKMRQGGEMSVLSAVASNLSAALTKAMKIAMWWMGTEAVWTDIEDDEVRIELNRDFMAISMDGPQLTALVNTWMRGGLSRESLIWNLKRGELLPPNRTIEEETELIAADASALGNPEDGRGLDEERAADRKLKADAAKAAAKAKADAAAKMAKQGAAA